MLHASVYSVHYPFPVGLLNTCESSLLHGVIHNGQELFDNILAVKAEWLLGSFVCVNVILLQQVK